MELKERLRKLHEDQKTFLREYEVVLKEYESSDLITQNENLQKELANYKKILGEIKDKYEKAQAENQGLRVALREQIFDEKMNILKISRQKIDTYFKDMTNENNNKLSALERSAEQRIFELKNIASKELGDDKDQFNAKVDSLFSELHKKIKDRRAEFDQAKAGILGSLEEEMNSLRKDEISQELIEKRMKQNDIEIKIGLNWINKVGIFLILLGVAYALKYSYYKWFEPYMKGIFSFAIGGIFLMAGELFAKKEKDVFAKGLIGGGIAILYYSIFNAYFNFKLFGLETAMMISVLVTAAALVLSIVHNSKTIGIFALIGGYLPFFTYAVNFGLNPTTIYIAMGYIFILNLLIVLISMYKRWSIVNYISFALNVPTLLYLIYGALPNAQTEFYGVSLIYVLITFSMYLIITLGYPFKNRLALKQADVMLLALNTFINCVITYSLFENAGLRDFKGVLAIIFCLVYFGLGQFVTKFMNGEKSAEMLFYLTSLTFGILTIPFQFGKAWLTLGWLIEGILLTIYGYKARDNKIEIAGWVTFTLCLGSFMLADFLPHLAGMDIRLFNLKYLAVTLGTLIISFMYLIDLNKDIIEKYTTRGQAVMFFKYFTVINLWVYAAYTTNWAFNTYIDTSKLHDLENFFAAMLFASVTVLIAFLVSKISLLDDKFVEYFAIFLYIIADLVGIIVTASGPVLAPEWINNSDVQYSAIAVVMLFNIFMLLNIRSLTIYFIKQAQGNLEAYPVVLALYILGAVSVLLSVQFRLGDVNLLFSLVYLALAFIYIIYGFKKNFVMVRRFGLGLSIFSTAKLFIYDLRTLEIVGKIIAYFGFGLVMLGISYIYQKLKNSLEGENKFLQM